MMNNVNELMNLVSQIRQNPIKVLSQKFNFPQNMSTNPQDILQYLLNSGQVSQEQINNAMQLRKQLMK